MDAVDVAPASSAPANDGMVTTETHERLKAELAAMTKRVGEAETVAETINAEKREKMIKMQPVIKQGIEAIMPKDTSGSCHLDAWVDGIQNMSSSDINGPMGIGLVNTIHAFSAKILENEGSTKQLSEKDDLLKRALADADDSREESAKNLRRFHEVQQLAEERLGQVVVHQKELAKLVHGSEKYSFGGPQSRATGSIGSIGSIGSTPYAGILSVTAPPPPQHPANTTAATIVKTEAPSISSKAPMTLHTENPASTTPMPTSTSAPGLITTIDQQSAQVHRTPAPMPDLIDEIRRYGSGNGRIYRANTSHSILGGAMDADMSAYAQSTNESSAGGSGGSGDSSMHLAAQLRQAPR
jgi:hypothetical protein